MTDWVIDENVLIVANDISRELSGQELMCPQANADCRIAALDLLKRCQDGAMVVLDDLGEVLDLYRRRMSGSGQPGSGDAFFRYLSDNQFNPERVIRRKLQPHAERGYEEFPSDEGLSDFDPADRIYVSLASGRRAAKIANCVDSDYKEKAVALGAAGIRVHELCPDCVK
jgi:hypothetical protein